MKHFVEHKLAERDSSVHGAAENPDAHHAHDGGNEGGVRNPGEAVIPPLA